MAYLFITENKRAIPNTETLLIFPFKDIWERDTTPRKEKAIAELSYIEFMTSHLKSNPYKGYETEKRKEILKRDLKLLDWEPDSLVEKAQGVIHQFQTEASPSYTLYQDAVLAKETLQQFIRTVDLNITTNNGALVLKPKDLSSALLDVEKVASTLTSLKRRVEEELYEEVKTRANKEISIFAKPESLNNY